VARYTWHPAELVKDTGGDSDSNKEWTVPTARDWHLYHITVVFTTITTEANRQLVVQCLNSDADVIAEAIPGAVQPASKVYTYNFAPGLADMTSFRDTDHMTTPIPGTWVLKAGQVLKVFDESSAAADTESDDIAVYVQGAWRGRGVGG